MRLESILNRIADSVLEGKDEVAVQAAVDAMNRGVSAEAVLEVVDEVVLEVGGGFSRGEVLLPRIVAVSRAAEAVIRKTGPIQSKPMRGTVIGYRQGGHPHHREESVLRHAEGSGIHRDRSRVRCYA